MTITIILVDLVSLEAAILGGGIVLSLRRVGEAVFAPIGGWLGDRLGTEAALFAATALTLAGLAAIALGGVYAGAGAVIVGRAALAALGPLLSGFFLAGFAIFEIYLVLILAVALLAHAFRRA